MSRPRVFLLGAALLVLLLALSPLVPRGEGDGGLRPSGRDQSAGWAEGWMLSSSPGAGRITATMRTEIDRVVAAGRTAGRLSGKQPIGRLVSAFERCADLDGQTYCLGVGWTDQTQAQVQARITVAARARTLGREATGDLDALDALARTAALPPAARARAERAELVRAARSVAKVWVLRHEIQGVPLPAGFLEEHPEARAPAPTQAAEAQATQAAPAATSTPPPTTARGSTQPTSAFTAPQCPTCPITPSPSPSPSPTAVPVKTIADYPAKGIILDPTQVAEQTRTYWCGPTSMQMIAWGWKGVDKGQDYWAGKLGTTTSGTSITDMVRVTNGNTGWDLPSHAGKYVVLDVGDFTFQQWLLLNMKHIVDYTAPLIYHPILLKRFYPYLDDDASGHYQVGRGYLEQDGKPTEVSYFEPWNQQRFDPSEPYINRVQWRDAYRSYRANLAHPLHNIGV